MPTWPEIQPMIGSTSRPGITHSDATEKPVARARGGMASDSATRMPGPSIASDAEITQLNATATTMFGASAKPIGRDRRADGDPAEEPDQAAHVAEEPAS